MSVGDDNGDDLEDKIERLVAEISQLTDIFRQAMTRQPLEEGEDTDAVQDLWDVGTQRNKVTSITEYRRVRSIAARSEDVVSPWLSGEKFDASEQVVNAHVQMFVTGVVNLEELHAGLSKEGFKNFVQKYHITASEAAGSATIDTELMAAADPRPNVFGITFVEGSVVINILNAPFSYVKAYGQTWAFTANPADELNLPSPSDTDKLEGQRSISDLNKQLASIALRKEGEDFPEEFVNLLDDEEREKYFKLRE